MLNIWFACYHLLNPSIGNPEHFMIAGQRGGIPIIPQQRFFLISRFLIFRNTLLSDMVVPVTERFTSSCIPAIYQRYFCLIRNIVPSPTAILQNGNYQHDTDSC